MFAHRASLPTFRERKGDFISALYQLRARGRPETIAEIAALTGRPVDEVARTLSDRVLGAFYAVSAEGCVGITHERRVHHGIRVERLRDGLLLEEDALCAPGALGIPFYIGEPVTISARCPVSGREIVVKASPNELIDVQPPEAVAAVVAEGDVDDPLGSTCAIEPFFASAEVAAGWHATHPQADLMPVADALWGMRQYVSRFRDVPRPGREA